MSRHRLPEGERRENVNVRFQKKVIDEIKKMGDVAKVIEKIVLEYLKKNKD